MKTILFSALLALVSTVSVAAHAGNIAAGKAAAEKYNCFSCHGADYNSPIDPSYPKLAGQHRDYLAHAMRAYQRGGKAANGRANAIMEAQVKPLSQAEIQNIAAYLSSLQGSLVLRR